jgi:hypothetical protein
MISMKTLSAREFVLGPPCGHRPELASTSVPADDMWSAPSEHTSVLEQSQLTPVVGISLTRVRPLPAPHDPL